ncbi:uncharacterized serine-rich protein C215.13 [Drosophila madeirensis]|uniref:Uncharacterized serine-rich protein C215.13 n=1 Tax=Drosophila madeirensis TaxID=30013 RepID=A0AAU9EWD6_DROMD
MASSRSLSNFSNRCLTIDLSLDGSGPIEINSTFNGGHSNDSESSSTSFSSFTSISNSNSTSSTSTTGFSSSVSSINTTFNISEYSDMNSVGYSASIDDDESGRDAGLSLDGSSRDAAGLSLDDSRLNSPSIDISQVEAEIDRINRYCEQIGANSGNESSVSNTSTPTAVRRVFRVNSPVEVIDLLNVDNSRPRAAIGRTINRVPEAVIDLCTPDRSIVPTATIDLDDSDFVPTNRRRNHASSSTPTTARATLHIDDSAPSSPKRKRNAQNVSSNEDVYKCPVCLDSVRHREPLSTKCGHVFCRPCIETAIRATHKCPMCNKKLSIRQTTRIYL